MDQLRLFEEEEEEQNYRIEEKTTVRLGRHSAQVSLQKKRREATQKLKEILAQLEERDIFISSCDGARGHFWLDDLLLRRLKVEWGFFNRGLPNVLVLWATRTAKGKQQHIRIFLDQLVDMREQHYGNGKPYYLIDFWNGFGEYPIDLYRARGYASLEIRPAR